jgi:hypothetical protein
MSPDETTAVVIYTDSFRIEGRIALMPGARLTDFVRTASAFIAVMDAEVSDRAGKHVFSSTFLDLGASWIELIVPATLARFPAAPGKTGPAKTARKPKRRR